MRQLINTVCTAFLLSITTSSIAALEDNSIDMELLQQAWKLPTGGAHNTPYYQLEINGIRFSGERPWEIRWEMIKEASAFQGKRILEIGSNVGLTSVFALKYAEAAAATIVDRPPALAGKFGMAPLWDVIALVHRAFDVYPSSLQLDLNADAYEDTIGVDYDIAVAMSILKWVEDKERFMRYLSNFSEVIYEGHDLDHTEIERFAEHGFNSYQKLGTSHVGASYPVDSHRTVFLFSKS
jgi:hypothetical protein